MSDMSAEQEYWRGRPNGHITTVGSAVLYLPLRVTDDFEESPRLLASVARRMRESGWFMGVWRQYYDVWALAEVQCPNLTVANFFSGAREECFKVLSGLYKLWATPRWEQLSADVYPWPDEWDHLPDDPERFARDKLSAGGGHQCLGWDSCFCRHRGNRPPYANR